MAMEAEKFMICHLQATEPGNPVVQFNLSRKAWEWGADTPSGMSPKAWEPGA